MEKKRQDRKKVVFVFFFYSLLLLNRLRTKTIKMFVQLLEWKHKKWDLSLNSLCIHLVCTSFYWILHSKYDSFLYIYIFIQSKHSLSLYVAPLKIFSNAKVFCWCVYFLALPHIFLLCDLFYFATCIYDNVEAITVRYMWVTLFRSSLIFLAQVQF